MSRVSWDIAAQSHENLRVFVWWSLTAYTWLYSLSSDVILIRHLHVSPSASYLPPPPHQILQNPCFSFELQPSQEKLKTMGVGRGGGGGGGGGQIRCLMGGVQVVNVKFVQIKEIKHQYM